MCKGCPFNLLAGRSLDAFVLTASPRHINSASPSADSASGYLYIKHPFAHCQTQDPIPGRSIPNPSTGPSTSSAMHILPLFLAALFQLAGASPLPEPLQTATPIQNNNPDITPNLNAQGVGRPYTNAPATACGSVDFWWSLAPTQFREENSFRWLHSDQGGECLSVGQEVPANHDMTASATTSSVNRVFLDPYASNTCRCYFYG